MTSPVPERERERGREERERMGGGTAVKGRGETALDGLAAEQMWVRKGLMERKGTDRERGKKRDHLY